MSGATVQKLQPENSETLAPEIATVAQTKPNINAKPPDVIFLSYSSPNSVLAGILLGQLTASPQTS